MKKLTNITIASIFIIAAIFAGCQSSNTDTDAESYGDDIFIGSDENVGAINIRIVDESINVTETTGFLVQVLDAAGRGVPGIRVTCDTEADLAIIEPSSGIFMTGSTGEASGVLGCEDRGSFMMACRLPSGGKREIARVKCEGDRPVDFDGFTGAGGGGLGNGVADVDDEDTNLAIRISEVSVDSVTEDGTVSIDTNQGVLSESDACPGEDAAVGTGDDTAEPFGDDVINFKITNASQQLVRFDSYTYKISGVSVSDPIDLIGEIPAGGEAAFSSLFLNALESNTGGDQGLVKYVYGGSSLSVDVLSPGFRNVTFTVRGELADGTPVSISTSTAFSFDNFNYCSN